MPENMALIKSIDIENQEIVWNATDLAACGNCENEIANDLTVCPYCGQEY